MHRKLYQNFTTLLLIGILLLSACNMPNGQPASPGAGESGTGTAIPSQTAIPASPTASPVPPSDTPTVIPSETATETPAFTATPEIVSGKVLKETNCRTGPAGNYDLVVTFQAGTMVELVGADLGNNYWLVKNPAQPDQTCWLSGSSLEVSGNTASLPNVAPPSSPTPSPSFKVEYKNTDNCKGPFLRFELVNTGSVAFRSAYIKVTDLKTGEVSEQSVNAFDLTVGCVVAKNIVPLNPGSTGYLQSTAFKKPFMGHKLKAIFMLCTEQGLKGACTTNTLDINLK